MNRILIVARESEFCEACRSAFRQANIEVLVRTEIIDALVELNWFTPHLIIWAIDPVKLSDLKALGVLRERYGRIPLLLQSQDEQVFTLSEMADLVMSGHSSVSRIVATAHQLLAQTVPAGTAHLNSDLPPADSRSSVT